MQPFAPPPPPPPPPQGWPGGGPPAPFGPPSTATSTDGKAVAALVLGILSIVTGCWLGAPLGVPAILLGALAHRDIRRSEGLSGGRGLATAGIVLGSIASTLFVVGWTGFVATAIYGVMHAPPAPSPPPPAFGPGVPPAAATTAPLAPPGGWASIHVVAVHPSPSATLRAQLAREVKAARLAGERVLVETIAPSCAACTEVALAMHDPALQTALERVRVVHVDVAEFGPEAAALRIDESELPWFYLLDGRGEPRDAISADEWDDNDPEEIAPVLDAFVHGTLYSRRQSWRRGGTTL